MLWAYTGYDPSSVANCHGIHNTDTAWVAYKTPRTPWRWQPLSKTCWGKIWNTWIKSTTHLTHLLVILKWFINTCLVFSCSFMSTWQKDWIATDNIVRISISCVVNIKTLKPALWHCWKPKHVHVTWFMLLKYKLLLTEVILGFIVLTHDMLNKYYKWAKNWPKDTNNLKPNLHSP
jgi:hypothetical protein